MFLLNILSFCIFGQSSCHSLVQQHRGTSTFYCFEVCSNDLALAVSRFCTDVSVSDNLCDHWTLVSAALVLYLRLLHSVVCLIML